MAKATRNATTSAFARPRKNWNRLLTFTILSDEQNRRRDSLPQPRAWLFHRMNPDRVAASGDHLDPEYCGPVHRLAGEHSMRRLGCRIRRVCIDFGLILAISKEAERNLHTERVPISQRAHV